MQNMILILWHDMYLAKLNLEDQLWSGKTMCLTPSHFVTKPPNLELMVQRQNAFLDVVFYY